MPALNVSGTVNLINQKRCETKLCKAERMQFHLAVFLGEAEAMQFLFLLSE